MRRPARWLGNGNQARDGRIPLRLPLGAAKKASRDRLASVVTPDFMTSRAGDGTRTHDVQLGKRHEAKGRAA